MRPLYQPDGPAPGPLAFPAPEAAFEEVWAAIRSGALEVPAERLELEAPGPHVVATLTYLEPARVAFHFLVYPVLVPLLVLGATLAAGGAAHDCLSSSRLAPHEIGMVTDWVLAVTGISLGLFALTFWVHPLLRWAPADYWMRRQRVTMNGRAVMLDGPFPLRTEPPRGLFGPRPLCFEVAAGGPHRLEAVQVDWGEDEAHQLSVASGAGPRAEHRIWDSAPATRRLLALTRLLLELRDRGSAAAPPPPPPPPPVPEEVAATPDPGCGVCREEVGPVGRSCGRCGAPHHPGCWSFLGGCGRAACQAPDAPDRGAWSRPPVADHLSARITTWSPCPQPRPFCMVRSRRRST